jgi:hypothetical protein
MLGVSMATSSITHNFVISPEGSKRFAESLERAEELASIPRPHFNGRILTDTSEILAFLAKNRPNGK